MFSSFSGLIALLVMAGPMLAFSFFKVIQDDEQKEETRIPNFIAMKYWEELSNPIVLKLPNGEKWDIFWEKRDDGIWLHEKNWKKIAQLYSLKRGSLLVFKYKRNSKFKVKIFNPNTLECCKYDIEGRGMHHREVEESGEAVKKKKTNSNGEPKSGPSKMTNNKGKRKIDEDFHDATQQEDSGANRGGIRRSSKADEAMKEMISRNFESETENPFCVTILTRSYLQQNQLLLPREFSTKHLFGLERNATIVVDEDLTSTWDVSFKFENVSERTRIRGDGWKLFCEDKKLKLDDACIFEMLKRDPVSFKVHIRTSEQLQAEMLENNLVCGRADSGSPSMNPVDNKFTITVNSTYYPNIPQEFMKKHNTMIDGENVTLKVEKRKWVVKVKKYESHARLSEGWGAFKRECKLNDGDICVFEMVDEKKLEFQISITICI